MQHATPVSAHSRGLLLWYAVLVGPVAWSGHLLFSYLLVSTACDTGQVRMRIIIAALTIVVEALVLSGAAIGSRSWRPPGNRLADDDGDLNRASFMGRLAVFEGVLFFVAALFTAAPVYFLRVCA